MPDAAVTQPAVQHRNFDQGFTLQGVSILVGLLVAVTVIITFFRNMRIKSEEDAAKRDAKLDLDAKKRAEDLKTEFRERNKEITDEVRKHNDDFGDRLTKVEARISDFMPRAEIEKAIEHEKTNRVQSQNFLKDQHTALARDVGEIRVSMGKLETRYEGMSGTMDEVKSLLKEMVKDIRNLSDEVKTQAGKH